MSGKLHALVAIPPGKCPGTHWLGGWVCCGLDEVMVIGPNIIIILQITDDIVKNVVVE